MLLNDEQRIQYLERSYNAVDGLWFMKVEELFGFDKALEIDNQVWNVLPKIQARFLKTVLKQDTGIETLKTCFTEKLLLDNFKFTSTSSGKDIWFIITECPWHNTMIKSRREDLSSKVGEIICNTEYSVWSCEFGDKIKHKIGSRICSGEDSCIVHFTSD